MLGHRFMMPADRLLYAPSSFRYLYPSSLRPNIWTIYMILQDASYFLLSLPDSTYSRPPAGHADHIATILDLFLTLSDVLDSSSFSSNYHDIAHNLLPSS